MQFVLYFFRIKKNRYLRYTYFIEYIVDKNENNDFLLISLFTITLLQRFSE
jgi:hypothetical protein